MFIQKKVVSYQKLSFSARKIQCNIDNLPNYFTND